MQKASQRILGGPREASFKFGGGPAKGLAFSCLSSHRYFFVRERYERELVEPLQRIIQPGMNVFEIGAHFGFWALALSRLCGPDGRVFAFEPIPENRARLQRNVEINSIANVTIVPLAASDDMGVAAMSSKGTKSALDGGEVLVRTTTIDAFCEKNPSPDLMLIDVEGFAGDVLRGAANTYARKFVPTICELHNSKEEEAFRAFVSGRTIHNLGRSTRFPRRVIAA
jgi:FkbM family methyltransferase